MILVQRLSGSSELTALRASGISFQSILNPLLLTSVFLGLLNFYIISELATDSHLRTKMLQEELRSINPLLLLEHRQLSKFKGLYINSMGPSHIGESASDIIIAIPNRQNNRLSVLLAKQIQTTKGNLAGTNVTLINNLAADEKDLFDHLIVENMADNITSTRDFSQIVKKQSSQRIHADHLKLSLLLLRIDEDLIELKQTENEQTRELYQKRFTRDLSEMIRRFSIALAVITFTLMGISFGIHIGRRQTYRGIIWVVGLTSFYLFSYFIAKELSHHLILPAILYIVPHISIVGAALFHLRRMSGGIE